MSENEVRLLLVRRCAGHGNGVRFAKAHGISPQHLSSMLTGFRKPSDKALDALGLERVTEYRRKEC